MTPPHSEGKEACKRDDGGATGLAPNGLRRPNMRNDSSERWEENLTTLEQTKPRNTHYAKNINRATPNYQEQNPEDGSREGGHGTTIEA